MNCPNKFWSIGSVCVATLLAAQSSNGELVFDNSTGDLLTRFNPTTYEVGDEIILAGGARTMTNFVFQYYGENFSGDEFAQVRFYVNDGGADPSGAIRPGTLFFDSGPFSIIATPRNTLQFDLVQLTTGNILNLAPGFVLPNSFTWTVQFSGITGTETAGVDLYNPPTTGWDYNSYWDNDPFNGGWLLKTNGSLAMNFGARIEAVPEPNAIALGLGGALLVILFRAGLRRK